MSLTESAGVAMKNSRDRDAATGGLGVTPRGSAGVRLRRRHAHVVAPVLVDEQVRLLAAERGLVDRRVRRDREAGVGRRADDAREDLVPDEHRVDDAEDRRGRADAEREREHGGDAKAGRRRKPRNAWRRSRPTESKKSMRLMRRPPAMDSRAAHPRALAAVARSPGAAAA